MQLLNKKDQTMGKGTTFIGQPVLNQVVNLMSKDKINILADEKGTNRYTKHLDSYTHLVIMLYAVLTNSSSLREVVLGFECLAAIGSIALKQEKVEMLPLVEQYVKENHKTNYAMKWSEWKKRFK